MRLANQPAAAVVPKSDTRILLYTVSSNCKYGWPVRKGSPDNSPPLNKVLPTARRQPLVSNGYLLQIHMQLVAGHMHNKTLLEETTPTNFQKLPHCSAVTTNEQ